MIVDNLNNLPDDINVVIAGSGPAGVSLALDLEKKGIKSIILETGDKLYTEKAQERYVGTVNGNFPNDLSLLRLSQFGGTTGHWGGTCRPLDEYDFTSWPISKKDLIKYQSDACNFLKISNQFRELEIDENLKIIEFQESEVMVFDAYFEQIKNSKDIYLSLNTSLFNINIENQKIKEIQIKKNRDIFRMYNKILVLACGGIENSRLLLWFKYHNQKLLDSSPVGNFWMEHPFKVVGTGIGNFNKIKKTFINEFHYFENFRNWGNFTVSVSPTEKMIKNKKILNSGVFLTLHDRNNNSLKNNIKDLLCIAPKLSNKIVEQFNKKLLCGITISSSWEQDPEHKNSISLINSQDDTGIPRVKLNYSISDKTLKTPQEMIQQLGDLFINKDLGRIAGESSIYDKSNFISEAGYHHLGGTIMGENSKYSVVDKNLKVHDVENFFVLGSSVFPTGGHANPTLTIVQLSLKLSKHLVSKITV